MPLKTEIREPNSTDKGYNQIPGIGNPWCGILNPRLSHNGFLILRAVSTETFPRECCSVSRVRYLLGVDRRGRPSVTSLAGLSDCEFMSLSSG